MYRYCAIYLFTILCCISCGSGLKTKMENMQPELDTAFYNKYIQKGPDPNIYPDFIFVSSQRDPTEKFGTPLLMDGDLKTWWSSGAGLNTGEHVVLEFSKLAATTCRVIVSNDPIMARISMLSIYINDSLAGNFPAGAPIPLPKNFKKIKIIAGETDGLNEVKLPVENDSTSKMQVTKKNLITCYNSKSFGIAEIEFYDAQGKKLPVKSPPVRKALFQGSYNTNPEERGYVFDGNTGTSTQWTKPGGEGKLMLTFPDFTPFTKLRIFTGGTDYLGYGSTEEVGFQINGKKEQKFSLKMGMNELNMTEPFVARTFTLSFYKYQGGGQFGALNELQGFDGARWYFIEPDSMYTRATSFRDSVAGTPLKGVLNNRISYAYDYLLLNTDTLIVTNPNTIDSKYIDKRVYQKSTILIRSNGTWEVNVSVMTVTMGKKITIYETTRNAFGDYKLASKNAEQVTLNVRYRVGETSIVDGRSGQPSVKIKKGKLVITKTTVSLDGVVEMLVSY